MLALQAELPDALGELPRSSIWSAALKASARAGAPDRASSRRASARAAVGDDDGVLCAHHEEAGGTGEASEVADVRDGWKLGAHRSPHLQQRSQARDATGHLHAARSLRTRPSGDSGRALTSAIVARLSPMSETSTPPRSSRTAGRRPGFSYRPLTGPVLSRRVAEFIYRNGGDVTEADQHTDEEEGMFFQRVEFRLAGFKLSRENFRRPWPRWPPPQNEVVRALLRRGPPCRGARLAPTSLPGRPAGPLVRPRNARQARPRGLQPSATTPSSWPLRDRLPVPACHQGDPGRPRGDLLEALAEADVELVVLARYMQVLSGGVIGSTRPG